MSVRYGDDIANDRFLFAAFLATILHAATILGVGFTREQHDPLPQSLEVTLSQRHDATENAQADFLAAANQLGSGTTQERQELSTPTEARFADDKWAPESTPQQIATDAALLDSIVETTRSRQRRDRPQQEDEPAAGADGSAREPVEPRAEAQIESLIARLAAERQEYARMPRIHRLTSLSTRAADDAEYLFAWKQRIESIGNQYYPTEARRRRLYGDLRLMVALRPDGSVLEIRVLQSSGERVLDDAAAHIVRLAAPFEPFPASLRSRVDVLQIIRTWQFRLNRLTSSD
jgi:periplasmic protein TonB